MNALPVAEIRERFLKFYEARGHQRLPSDSLIPANDPTLLFTGAGMNQFKDMFLGKGALPYKRVTTAQKCLRVPDLEHVGVTPRHHTFFEMLGHFSFGDYFKKECIAWEWEFFSAELGIPEHQMVVSVYEADDEAYEIWRNDIGLEPARIFRFGEKENFWPAEAPSKGPNGPCGPCSEIYFDALPDQPYPDQDGLVELPDDRFTEIGNCVFTQFERQPDGSMEPLPQRNIDVGLGLERIAAVVAGAPNNFETDLFAPYLAFVGERCGTRYGEDPAADVRIRRIADHIRALVFCIADGAIPSNEGRGYVVRKILRRASRDGYELGIEQPFLHDMVEVVCQTMGDAYPEIREHAGQCRSLIRGEEEGFATVYRQGRVRLEQFVGQLAAEGSAPVVGSGDFAFQLHDTYGFPVDITRQMMSERGFELADDEFDRAMEAQRTRARAAATTSSDVFADNAAMALRDAGAAPTEFVGYDNLTADTEVIGLLTAEHRVVDEISGDAPVFLVTAHTPFYAQGGGQVGDRGTVSTAGGSARIVQTTAQDGYHLHQIEGLSGVIRRGETCHLEVDREARYATERNHTATHLLHSALKRVLGDHVNQAGSVVDPDRLRFDFTHGEKLSESELDEIETMVSAEVMAATAVQSAVRPIDEARADGYMALFGEKYGDRVRTLAVGDFSKELCGGTHVANSGNIGAFRIVSETAISAGTRRIEAVTGPAASAMARAERGTVADLSRLLKVPGREVAGRVAQLAAEAKDLRKQLARATAPDVDAVVAAIAAAAHDFGGVRCAVFQRPGLDMKSLQEALGRARRSLEPFVGVGFVPAEDQVLVAAAVSADVGERISAADLVRAAAGAMGGGGGGRTELAQGKGKQVGQLPQAERAVQDMLSAAGLWASAG